MGGNARNQCHVLKNGATAASVRVAFTGCLLVFTAVCGAPASNTGTTQLYPGTAGTTTHLDFVELWAVKPQRELSRGHRPPNHHQPSTIRNR